MPTTPTGECGNAPTRCEHPVRIRHSIRRKNRAFRQIFRNLGSAPNVLVAWRGPRSLLAKLSAIGRAAVSGSSIAPSTNRPLRDYGQSITLQPGDYFVGIRKKDHVLHP